MNAVIMGVLVMLVLSVFRINVVLSLIIGAFAGGLAAGLPVADYTPDDLFPNRFGKRRINGVVLCGIGCICDCDYALGFATATYWRDCAQNAK